MTWEPILEGALADLAWEAFADILRDLEHGSSDELDSDRVVFFAYAAGVRDDVAAVCDLAIDGLVATVHRGLDRVALFDGLAGAGWALAHVSDDADELLSAIDEALVATIDDARAFDLVTGLAGMSVYFLERVRDDAPVARRGLARIVERLDEMARIDPAGVSWLTFPEQLSTTERSRYPAGYTNCGVAHGVPGVAAVLARIAAIPDPPTRARELCADAIRWTAAQRLSPDPHARFPSRIADGRRIGRPRNAWCYGDPGIAAALWSASIRIGMSPDDWRALAIEASSRAVDACDVEVAGLCHGAIGLAHLFNRFYQASRDRRFRDIARAWFARGLAMRRPGHGAGGFVTQHRADGSETLVARTDLIEGAAGIGLALLAGLTVEEPGWDRLLACDIPTAS